MTNLRRRAGAPAILGAVMFASFCSRSPEVVNTVAPILSGARIYYDDGPAFQDSVCEIIRDRVLWRDVWSQATSIQPSPPPIPEIDFEREMIVVVGGGRMKAGDQFGVDSAGVQDTLFRVVYTTVECRRFPEDVYPFEIIRVPRADHPAYCVKRTADVSHCRQDE